MSAINTTTTPTMEMSVSLTRAAEDEKVVMKAIYTPRAGEALISEFMTLFAAVKRLAGQEVRLLATVTIEQWQAT